MEQHTGFQAMVNLESLSDADLRRLLGIALQHEMDDRDRLKTDFASFVKKCFATVDPGAVYKHNWHIDLMCEYLEACRRKEIKRLIINVPPRTLKSNVCTIAWPAWILGHDPRERILCASFSHGLSYDHSIACREVIQSEWYQHIFPKTQLSKDQNEKGKFITTERGLRMATSSQASKIGEGANYLIGDDLMNAEQAISKTEAVNINGWTGRSFLTRFNDPENGVCVIVAQRLGQNDTTGFLLEQGGWEHLCLPARNDGEKKYFVMGKFHHVWPENELLFEKRLPDHVLEQKRRELGNTMYAGQYMQKPAPEGGAILMREWWNVWDKPQPEWEMVVQSWDTAFKEGEENDFSVCETWGINNGGRGMACLLDTYRAKVGFPELKKRALELYRRGDGVNPADYVLIEDKASGQSLIQELKKMGLPIKPVKVRGDKVQRAHAAAPVLEAGNIYYIDKFANQIVLEEAELFPNGKNDDTVDACLGGDMRVFTDKGLIEIKNIKVGDRVLTHNGRYRVVMSTMARTSDHHYELKADGYPVLQITGNHPVYAAHMRRPQTHAKSIGSVAWINTEDLKPVERYQFHRSGKMVWQKVNRDHHAMTFPLLPSEGKIFPMWPVKGYRITENIPAHDIDLDYDFGWLCGMYLAEGCYHERREGNRRPQSMVGFSCDKDSLERAHEILRRKFLYSKGSIGIGNHCWRLSVVNRDIAKFFSQFGIGAENLFIPEWAMTANADFKRGILDGWVNGDGYIQKVRGVDIYSISSCNEGLVRQGALLAISLGLNARTLRSKASGPRKTFDKISICREEWRLHYRLNTGNRGVSISNGHVMTADISSLKRIDGPITVYNISVEEDESYVTEAGTVHNCTQFLRYFRERLLAIVNDDWEPDEEDIEQEEMMAMDRDLYG